MKRSWKKMVLLVFSSAVLLIGSYVSVRAYRLHNLRAHFGEVREGQSKQEVISRFGSPSEDVGCYVPGASEDYRRRCAERFWYYGFLEEWIVDFDEQGKVIGAYHSVSP